MDRKRRAAWIEIDIDALKNNFRAIRNIAGDSAVAASVKAEAYGHGAAQISKALESEGADYLGVATLDEAASLRESGIKLPIIIYGAVPRGCGNILIELDVTPVIFSYNDAKLLSDELSDLQGTPIANIIIALDTGMGRIGFLNNENSIDEIARIAKLPNIHISGIASHLAASEEPDISYTLRQLDEFEKFAERLAEVGIEPGIRSIANSAALARFPASRCDVVRPGIILYGIYPSDEIDRGSLPLTPVMSVKANIVCLKKVPEGFHVSYGRKFSAKRESLIATLPLGYADGLPRLLSNTGRVIVNGVYAPIVGNICMDQCMIDVTDVPDIAEYNEVVILGRSGDLEITADEIAEKSGTIAYEALCRFGQRLPKL